MRTIKSMLLVSRKRAREMENRIEGAKRTKFSGNLELQTVDRKKQDAEIDEMLAQFQGEMTVLEEQVKQLERLERERRKLFSIIRKEKMSILLCD